MQIFNQTKIEIPLFYHDFILICILRLPTVHFNNNICYVMQGRKRKGKKTNGRESISRPKKRTGKGILQPAEGVPAWEKQPAEGVCSQPEHPAGKQHTKRCDACHCDIFRATLCIDNCTLKCELKITTYLYIKISLEKDFLYVFLQHTEEVIQRARTMLQTQGSPYRDSPHPTSTPLCLCTCLHQVLKG